MIKQITRDVVDKIIDKSQYLAYYVNLPDMDLQDIDSYQKATRDLLNLLGDMLEFNPFESEEEDDGESFDYLSEQIEKLRNWMK